MKKEVLGAVIVGIIFGLVFTFGIWLANKSLKEAGVKTVSLKPETVISSPTPVPVDTSVQNFTISAPENFLLTNASKINLTGTKIPDSILVLLSQTASYVIPPSTQSAFTQPVNLEAGYNQIKIIALDKDGKQLGSEQRLVTYSTTTSLFTPALTASVTPQPTSTGSPLRNSVQEKVAEQIAEIKKNTGKRAYLGTVDSLTDASLVLTDPQGNKHSITVPAETVIKLKNNSEGTLKDIKSGNTILAMGDGDSAGNLLAKRVLIIDPPAPDKRQILFGKVSAFTSKTLTVNDTVLNITKDTLFQPSKYTFKDVDPGFQVLSVHTTTATSLIYVLSEK